MSNPKLMSQFTLIFSLLLLCHSSQLVSFVDFTAFSFPSSNSTEVINNEQKLLLFPLDDSGGNQSQQQQFNLSLTSGPEAGIVITATLCTTNIISVNVDLSSTQSPNASPKSNSSKNRPILFASSLDYQSTLLNPAELTNSGVCKSKDASFNSAASFLQLEVNSLAKGSEGTVALRPLLLANDGKSAGPYGRRKIEEISANGVGRVWLVEEHELLLGPGQAHAIALNAPAGSEFGEEEQFTVDLAVRRGQLQLSIVQLCPPLNESVPAWNSTLNLAANFSTGQFRHLLAGSADDPIDQSFQIIFSPPGNGTDNLTSQVWFFDCLEANKQPSTSPHIRNWSIFPATVVAVRPPPLLFLQLKTPNTLASNLSANASNGQTSTVANIVAPTVLALSLTRTFRPLLVVGGEDSQRPGGQMGLFTFILICLFVPLLLLALIGAAALLMRHLLIQQRRVHYESERRKALDQRVGFFELNVTPVQRQRSMPEAKEDGQQAGPTDTATTEFSSPQHSRRKDPRHQSHISVTRLAHRALGTGWM